MQPDQSPRPCSDDHGLSSNGPHRSRVLAKSLLDLAGLSFAARDITQIDYVSALQEAAERLNCCAFRTELMHRIEQSSEPLPSSLEQDVALARTRFERMSPQAQLEIVQQVFTPAIMDRAAWAIPGCPFVKVASPDIPAEAQEFSKKLIHEILDCGNLSPLMAMGALHALGFNVPRTKTASVQTLMLLTSVATIGAVICGAPWGAAAIVATGALMVRGVLRRPDPHREFAAGCLLECMDADQVLRGTSDTIPTLQDSVDSYFNDPKVPRLYKNILQSEGFLASRILRAFGNRPVDIVSGFSDPNSLSPEDSSIINLLQEALDPQEVSLDQPLTVALEKPTEGANETTISLLEMVNLAHFTWALRDKHMLRHEVATLIRQQFENPDLGTTG